MFDNVYLMEMTVRSKVQEIARGADAQRVREIVGVRPAPVRRAIASSIVRFGIEAPCRREEAHAIE
jgi:hypothetical protein